jgi:phage virion morphogenesis (putative tail completion) protein
VPTLENKGWFTRSGPRLIADSATGEVLGKKLTPARMRLIFDQNMQSAYMAGRWRQMKDNVAFRPWWQYTAVMDIGRITNPDRAPLMRALSEDMHNAVMDNFAAQGRPAWLGLAPSTLASRPKRVGGMILQDSGTLLKSIQAESGPDYAIVGTNQPYAAAHNFGVTTRPHVIRPKNKKALFWPGGPGPRKLVNHPGSKIPARPFLTLTDSDQVRMLLSVSQYLKSLI